MSIKSKLKSDKESWLYKLITNSFYYVQRLTFLTEYAIYRPFGLKNRVIASSFSGRKYGGNPKYILEKIHNINPDIELIWIKDNSVNYDLPTYVKAVDGFRIAGSLKKYYYYISSKIWIDSHFLYGIARKRKKQFFIETWHGGLGIKKIGMDSEEFRSDSYQVKKMKATVALADLFVSNSDHISNVYKTAFLYTGEIMKCGYPENDVLINGRNCKRDICKLYDIPYEDKLLLYAPTFRSNVENGKHIDLDVYNINYLQLKKQLENKFGGHWSILIRWHPIMEGKIQLHEEGVVDVTSYPDIQNLIASCDCAISDYSSCIFDAAVRRIPCFTYTSDIDSYETDRGVYYRIKDLPFPNATNNEELMHVLETFDMNNYLKNWDDFVRMTGLIETGNAATTVANIIINKMNLT